jgi:hypothetical protein
MRAGQLQDVAQASRSIAGLQQRQTILPEFSRRLPDEN